MFDDGVGTRFTVTLWVPMSSLALLLDWKISRLAEGVSSVASAAAMALRAATTYRQRSPHPLHMLSSASANVMADNPSEV